MTTRKGIKGSNGGQVRKKECLKKKFKSAEANDLKLTKNAILTAYVCFLLLHSMS